MRERGNYPDFEVEISVRVQTDENGDPLYAVHLRREYTAPRGEVLS